MIRRIAQFLFAANCLTVRPVRLNTGSGNALHSSARVRSQIFSRSTNRKKVDVKVSKPEGQYERFQNRKRFYEHPRFPVFAGFAALGTGLVYFSHLERVPFSDRSRFIWLGSENERRLGQVSFNQVRLLGNIIQSPLTSSA